MTKTAIAPASRTGISRPSSVESSLPTHLRPRARASSRTAMSTPMNGATTQIQGTEGSASISSR